MTERKRHYPKLETLGLDCLYWSNGRDLNKPGCLFPKLGLQGRRSCEGVVDDVCIWQLTDRIPRSLTKEQIRTINSTSRALSRGNILPPGDTKP